MKQFFILSLFMFLFLSGCIKNDKEEKVTIINPEEYGEKIVECINSEKLDSLPFFFENKKFTEAEYNRFAYLLYTKYKNIDEIIKLVKYGLSVNYYCDKDTLLQVAVKRKELDNVKTLLNMGADICLFNKSGEYTALTLSIQSFGNNSQEIFNELMNHVKIDDFEKEQKYGEKEQNSVFWYYQMIIDKNKRSMLKVFLENDGIFNKIISDSNVLKFVAIKRNMFCEENNSVLYSDLPVDENYEYFGKAFYAKNPDAIEYFMEKNIKIFGINFYEIFMKRYHMGVDAETPFATTEEYAKLVDLYEKVKEYYLLQNDK